MLVEKGKENIYYVNVAKVREDENEWKEFKSRYSINSTPTFTVYREGGFESIPRTRFVRIFSRFQRVSISSF
ncbi:hypothetical protein DVX06_12030, partial [Enterococcus faecium]